MESKTYRGWAMLTPLSNRASPLVRFMIPLDVEGRYAVGDRDTVEGECTLSLLVPESKMFDGSGSGKSIEAIITVDSEGKVYLERPKRTNEIIWMNGQAVEAGERWPSMIAIGSTLSFGPWQYLLVNAESFIGQRRMATMAGLDQCNVCRGGRCEKGVRILACGHNICATCHRKGLAQSAPSRFDRRHGFVESQLHCFSCRSRITAGAANASVISIITTEGARTMATVNAIDSKRPMCEHCRNSRGLIASADYELCAKCDRLACPSCVLQYHREHELKPKTDRLRGLDEVAYKVDSMSKMVQDVERLGKETFHAERHKEKTLIRTGKVAECLRQMATSLNECHRQLNEIVGRKQALARGWDKTSSELEANFNRAFNDTLEMQRNIQRLRNEQETDGTSSSEDGPAEMYVTSGGGGGQTSNNTEHSFQ